MRRRRCCGTWQRRGCRQVNFILPLKTLFCNFAVCQLACSHFSPSNQLVPGPCNQPTHTTEMWDSSYATGQRAFHGLIFAYAKARSAEGAWSASKRASDAGVLLLAESFILLIHAYMQVHLTCASWDCGCYVVFMPADARWSIGAR